VTKRPSIIVQNEFAPPHINVPVHKTRRQFNCPYEDYQK
jgi:hypothetical protein